MSQNTLTLSANIPEDSELHEDFERFRERTGTNSNAEAVRSLMREGIEHQRDQSPDGTQSSQDVVSDSSQNDINLVSTDKLPALFGVGFLIGADGLRMSLQATAGEFVGSILFGTIGITIVAGMMPLFVASMRNLIRNLFSGAARADTDAAAEAEP